jgi:hypothetical protein
MGARGREVVTRERSWTVIARRMLAALPAGEAALAEDGLRPARPFRADARPGSAAC